MQWTRLMFLWLSGETFDLLPAGVNCLGVWSLFKSQVFSPQFFINVFYLVLQLKCHCFYDGSAYQGKCFQTGLFKYRYVNFWNFFLIILRVMDNLLKEKRKYFSKLLKNTDNLFKLTCSLSLWSGLSIFFLFKLRKNYFVDTCIWHMQSNMTWYNIKRKYI